MPLQLSAFKTYTVYRSAPPVKHLNRLMNDYLIMNDCLIY